ncbi:hypothetical protein HDU98_006490 [Podochytrium sp. JEL0797]|nr:hypothetical protein HDU98_006490 [Podochytrium sp. JEL0797]
MESSPQSAGLLSTVSAGSTNQTTAVSAGGSSSGDQQRQQIFTSGISRMIPLATPVLSRLQARPVVAAPIHAAAVRSERLKVFRPYSTDHSNLFVDPLEQPGHSRVVGRNLKTTVHAEPFSERESVLTAAGFIRRAIAANNDPELLASLTAVAIEYIDKQMGGFMERPMRIFVLGRFAGKPKPGHSKFCPALLMDIVPSNPARTFFVYEPMSPDGIGTTVTISTLKKFVYRGSMFVGVVNRNMVAGNYRNVESIEYDYLDDGTAENLPATPASPATTDDEPSPKRPRVVQRIVYMPISDSTNSDFNSSASSSTTPSGTTLAATASAATIVAPRTSLITSTPYSGSTRPSDFVWKPVNDLSFDLDAPQDGNDDEFPHSTTIAMNGNRDSVRYSPGNFLAPLPSDVVNDGVQALTASATTAAVFCSQASLHASFQRRTDSTERNTAEAEPVTTEVPLPLELVDLSIFEKHRDRLAKENGAAEADLTGPFHLRRAHVWAFEVKDLAIKYHDAFVSWEMECDTLETEREFLKSLVRRPQIIQAGTQDGVVDSKGIVWGEMMVQLLGVYRDKGTLFDHGCTGLRQHFKKSKAKANQDAWRFGLFLAYLALHWGQIKAVDVAVNQAIYLFCLGAPLSAYTEEMLVGMDPSSAKILEWDCTKAVDLENMLQYAESNGIELPATCQTRPNGWREFYKIFELVTSRTNPLNSCKKGFQRIMGPHTELLWPHVNGLFEVPKTIQQVLDQFDMEVKPQNVAQLQVWDMFFHIITSWPPTLWCEMLRCLVGSCIIPVQSKIRIYIATGANRAEPKVVVGVCFAMLTLPEIVSQEEFEPLIVGSLTGSTGGFNKG